MTSRLNLSQAGLTLMELLVSLLVGMLVLLTASALLLQTKSAYLFQDEAAQIEATGQHALQLIAHATRQTAYVSTGASCPDSCPPAGGQGSQLNQLSRAGLSGIDDASLQGKTGMLPVSSAPSINGSDVLVIRFDGAGKGRHGDGTVVNCAGFGIPANDLSLGDNGYGWSIFHVTRDGKTGLPRLVCRYRSDKGWATQALASGVEALQILYGVDLDGDGIADRIMNAAGIRRMDAGADARDKTLPQAAPHAAVRGDLWDKVVLVRLAVLVSDTSAGRPATRPLRVHELFGPDYANEHGDDDPGVRLNEADLPAAERYRMRKVFAMTLHLPPTSAGAAQ